MKISIKQKLSEIQQEFHSKFPYLKLEFYKKQHKQEERSQPLNGEQTIKEVSPDAVQEDFDLDGQLKLSTLEQKIYDTFGLNIQVLRKSGDSWVTTNTRPGNGVNGQH